MRIPPTRFSALFGFATALFIAPAEAQSAERRIDGTDAARFEASVASLQNGLSARRRENFNVALAMIWARNTVEADFDGDGDMDLDDIRLLDSYADDLLTNIRRGNVVTAIEARAKSGDEYTAKHYFDDLDGLGYDEVVSLAGVSDAESYLAAVARFGGERPCPAGEQSVIRLKRCDGFASPRGQAVGVAAGKAIGAAMLALNEQKYAEARAAIGTRPMSSATTTQTSDACYRPRAREFRLSASESRTISSVP